LSACDWRLFSYQATEVAKMQAHKGWGCVSKDERAHARSSGGENRWHAQVALADASRIYLDDLS
jgi:hypothetical protein